MTANNARDTARHPAEGINGVMSDAPQPSSDAPQPSRIQSFLLSARVALLTIAAGLWAALGTFWSIYAWYHQEVVVPSTAPVNLTTEVSVEEVGFGAPTKGSSEEQLDAIQLMVTANNVSSKNIYLLTNYWDAWGGKVAPRSSNADMALWLRNVNQWEAIQNETGQLYYSPSGKYYEITAFERVAWGNIFPASYILYPKETISASVVFYVPKNSYDLVHVEVHIPTTEKLKMVDLMFVVDADRVKPKFFKVGPQGQRTEVVEQAEIDALKVQETQSRRQLSLWHAQAKPATNSTPLKSSPQQ
jgi:hypothetical protein